MAVSQHLLLRIIGLFIKQQVRKKTEVAPNREAQEEKEVAKAARKRLANKRKAIAAKRLRRLPAKDRVRKKVRVGRPRARRQAQMFGRSAISSRGRWPYCRRCHTAYQRGRGPMAWRRLGGRRMGDIPYRPNSRGFRRVPMRERRQALRNRWRAGSGNRYGFNQPRMDRAPQAKLRDQRPSPPPQNWRRPTPWEGERGFGHRRWRW